MQEQCVYIQETPKFIAITRKRNRQCMGYLKRIVENNNAIFINDIMTF